MPPYSYNLGQFTHPNRLTMSDSYPLLQYDPQSLQFMLDFFRDVAHSLPTEQPPTAGGSSTSPDGSSPTATADGVVPVEPGASSPRSGAGNDDASKRAGIIVLREDLDFYAIPNKAGINHPEMIEVKRAAAKALLKQDGIFSGLKRSDEPGTTEAHLIEMLTAG